MQFFETVAAIDEFAEASEFDYLFSVASYEVLPAALLARARRFPINYHDGPLPRYAGTYATSWALMHREPTHGVTWHVMVPKLDAGDLLKQVPVPVDPNDTAECTSRSVPM